MQGSVISKLNGRRKGSDQLNRRDPSGSTGDQSIYMVT